jgi:hypothetical protein
MEQKVGIRDLVKELEGIGFNEEQADKILEWVEKIPIQIYSGENIHVVVKKGCVMVNSDSIDPYDLSFNLLDKQTRLNLLYYTGKFYNPFKIPKETILFNPFSGDLRRADGSPAVAGTTTHYMHNPFTCKIHGKVDYVDDKPIRFWLVNDQNEWVIDEERTKNIKDSSSN